MEAGGADLDNRETEKEDSGTSMALILLLSSLMTIALIYAIRNRSFEDFVKYGLYIFLSLTVISIFVLIIYLIKNWKDKLTRDIIILLGLIFPFAFAIAGITYYSIFVTLKDAFLWIKSPSLNGSGAIIMTALLTLAVGLILFYIRLKIRAVYGFSEAAIGLAVAANRIATQADDIKNPAFYLAMLTASIYLVVRGFDNIHQGLTREPKDPVGMKIYEFLRKKA